jgi:hypothetical protein
MMCKCISKNYDVRTGKNFPVSDGTKWKEHTALHCVNIAKSKAVPLHAMVALGGEEV